MNDYEKLGLKEGASKEAIQTAYRIRLLRYQQLENKTDADEAEFKEIDEAYNRLCGYDVPLEEVKHGKLKDFLYYNKEKFAVLALVLVLVIVVITQSMNKPHFDFSIAVIGVFETKSEDYSVDVEESISLMMKEEIVDINSPLITTYPRDPDGSHLLQNSAYYTMQQKLMTELSFGETGIDLLLLDEEN